MKSLCTLSRNIYPCTPPSDSASGPWLQPPLQESPQSLLIRRLPNSPPRSPQATLSGDLSLFPQSRPPFHSSEPLPSGPTSFSQLPSSALISFPLSLFPQSRPPSSAPTSFLSPDFHPEPPPSVSASFLPTSSLSPDLLSLQPPLSASSSSQPPLSALPQRLSLPASRSRIRPGQAPPPLRGRCSPS